MVKVKVMSLEDVRRYTAQLIRETIRKERAAYKLKLELAKKAV
jgi:hypothetical protein